MSEKFNPLGESCQAACVRAVSEELKAEVTRAGTRLAAPRAPFEGRCLLTGKTSFAPDFDATPMLAKVAAFSVKYGGLPSEYHVRCYRNGCPTTIVRLTRCVSARQAVLLHAGPADVRQIARRVGSVRSIDTGGRARERNEPKIAVRSPIPRWCHLARD
jgi:hypothetical protein